MAVPFFDHKAIHDPIREELMEAFGEVLAGDALVLGNQVQAFEKEFSAYLSCHHAAGVNSGLDALVLALQALEIGPGDEVIVPANTYIATWNAVYLTGARPVPVEPDPQSMNLDPERILEKINSRTKAIIPVHLYGLPCAMDRIMQMAEAQGVYVVEDNAQAVGASYMGRNTGSWGHINGTSFYPTKNLGALGDAGMVTSDNPDWIRRVKALRNYGSHIRYVSDEIGLNSRLDEVQAALLRVKLKYLDQMLHERRKIAAAYREGLKKITTLTLPPDRPEHTYHLFVIRSEQRDALMQHLSQRNIQTLIHYPIPPHLQKAYSFLGYQPGDFPITESIANTCLSLPLYNGFNQVDEVVDGISAYFT